MKISDLHISYFNGISKIEQDGTIETLYLIGMNTFKVRFDQATGIISSLQVNGINIPLENNEIISQFNATLDNIGRITKAYKKPGFLISDLHLDSLNGITKISPDGTIETLYLIGMNTFKVRFDQKTGIVSSLQVNGSNIPLENSEIINQFNATLDNTLDNSSGLKVH